MAEFKPTPSQKLAIEDRGGELLVSAAAGSGKTRVLTERLMRWITEGDAPRSIDNFLIITFSTAAAAELRSRISEELSARAAADPGSKRLRRESALVRRAQIGTIHSFCSALLREYAGRAGIAPDFAIADEDRARELRRLSLETVLEAAYAEAEPGFIQLADTVGAGTDDRRLESLVLELHGKLQSHARPGDWAARQSELFETGAEDAADTPWGRELLESAADELLWWAGEFDELVRSLAGFEKMGKAYVPSFSETASSLRGAAKRAAEGWDALREALPIAFPRLGSLRGGGEDPELAERAKARREACKKAAKRIEKGFTLPSEQLLRDMRATAPAMRALLKLVGDFDAEYTRRKRRRSLLDFADLEHLAARLLTEPDGSPTETAREVSRRYAEVMVDEYQDVSLVQDMIIRAVSDSGRRLFMVGDVKQSIYRFRLADPTIFLKKYESYADAPQPEGVPRRVFLRESFRSRGEVVDAVNAVFGCLMSKGLGEMEYDERARLRAGLEYPGVVPVPELVAVPLPGADEDEERPDKIEVEAAYVARMMRRLVETGAKISEGSALRPLGYGDIAVLLRSVNVSGPVWRRVLAREGVPVEAGQSGGFFEAPEVAVILSLLAVIDNPRQDVALISVLRSELFGFTNDELTEIRLMSGEGDFYAALSARAEVSEKARAFLDTLDRLRDFARDSELATLIWEIYESLGCMALCSAMRDGEGRRARLLRLFELARSFETTGWRGLRRFLDWLRSMRERGEEPAFPDEDGGGAVRIMSIHRSKGLEFPVVFIGDTARQFNRSDLRGSVLVHPELGLGPKFTDAARGIEYPTLARRAVANRLERELLSEELRLLYVAMTRARERLFITCAMADPQKTMDKLAPAAQEHIPAQALLPMRSMAEWLICAALGTGGRALTLSIGGDEEGVPRRVTPAAQPEPERTGEEASPVDFDALLAWRYPHSGAETLPSKLTATELKSLAEPDAESAELLPRAARTFRRPDIALAARRLTAAERGTATHLALRYLELGALTTPEAAREAVDRLAAAGKLSACEAAAVDAAGLCRFALSPLGRRIAAAPRVLREFPFALLCPAERFFPGAEGEELLLQGVVDCCLIEPDGAVIVDYKTDRIAPEAAPERAKRYAAQLETYAWAVSRITGLAVKAKIVYFLQPGEAVEL
ncbi:MAG: helicase-exonuclease AddAB subunit AddA [Oscillospiraceae bacterium]|nr:helicase-exonuclease AddAB subunit AddA [Oscillospiraceae bacterium]